MGLDLGDPLNTTLIAESWGLSGVRWHFRENATVSDWFNLSQGKEYYLWARHREGSGTDNFQVGVEIDQTAVNNDNWIPDHHHAMKEVQYISLGANDLK